MIFLILAGLFITSPIQFQHKYDFCKSVSFEAKDDYCSLQKKLSKYENKTGEKDESNY